MNTPRLPAAAAPHDSDSCLYVLRPRPPGMTAGLRAAAAILALAATLSIGPVAGADAPAFPVRDLLPKDLTGAARLLARDPAYDGRGIVIAILDTGVDPGAPGLSVTTTGEPKFVDLIDATGDGDVDTSTVRELAAGPRRIAGLSGRTLQLAESWTNPTGKWHVGLKAAYEFFPDALVARMQQHRREQFQEWHRRTTDDLERAVRDPVADSSALPELRTRLAVLGDAPRHTPDPGPVFDCVVFHDGVRWRAAVDTDEDGDLAEETLLTDYDAEPKHGTFPHPARLNFTVHINPDGKLLSLVCDSGTHGTHVAGITAGYFPAAPDRNGLAPGARLVSIKIGDGRLGTMETPRALRRACAAIQKHRCHLVNMSYGEPSRRADQGRLMALFAELVREHGVIFVASAGNAGPALSTVGAPGGVSTPLLGIGAYLTPEMAAAQYSRRPAAPGIAYTWSSRGPTEDGDVGVDLFAPGGAVASVPQWTLSPSQQMNGTSMASPNACGSVAVLLSACRAQSIRTSPASVERALKRTALRVPTADAWAQGAGLLQVDAAFDFMTQQQGGAWEAAELEVNVNGPRPGRGVLIREPWEQQEASEWSVFLRPRFPGKEAADQQQAFERYLRMESTVPWAACAESLVLTAGGRAFDLRIDPRALPPGAHHGFVLIFDAAETDRGPIARVPLTVLRPAPGQADSRVDIQVAAGQVVRHFVAVPDGATWAEIAFQSGSGPAPAMATLHCRQQVPGHAFDTVEHQQILSFRDRAEQTAAFKVRGGRTLEICLAGDWRTPFELPLSAEIRFRGVQSRWGAVPLLPEGGAATVELRGALAAVDVAPEARLTAHRTWLAPSRSDIRPLTDPRDQFPDGRTTYELRLHYPFEFPTAASATFSVPALDGRLYEADVEGPAWMLFNADGRTVASDDFEPGAVQLGAGRHELVVQVCAAEKAALESLRGLRVAVDRSLPGATLRVFSAPGRTPLLGGPGAGSRRLAPGEAWEIELAVTGLPGAPPDGAWLGELQVAPHTTIPLVLPVPTPAWAPTLTPPERTPRVPDELFSAKLKLLQELETDAEQAAFEALLSELLADPSLAADGGARKRQVLQARLHREDRAETREFRTEQIIAAADALIAELDPESIARGLAQPAPAEITPSQAADARRDRDLLVDALHRKARAVAYRELPEVVARQPLADPAANDQLFESTLSALRRWVDTREPAYALLHVRADRRKGRNAAALQLLLQRFPGEPASAELLEKRRDLYDALGWTPLKDYEDRWRLRRFPPRRADF